MRTHGSGTALSICAALAAAVVLACAPAPVAAPASQPAGPPAAAPAGKPAEKAAGQPGEKPVAVAKELRTLRVGLLPIANFVGLYVAEEKGFLAEQGLAVEKRMMAGGGEILPALIGGSLDLGATNVFSHILAKDGGFDLKAVAGITQQVRDAPETAVLVKQDAPIRTARDLEGKTLAINLLNNIDHVMLQEWLELKGANPKAVTFVEVPYPQHGPALQQDRVHAVAPPEPFKTILKAQGARVLAYHYVEVSPRVLQGYIVASSDWLQKNTDVVRRFAAAVQKGETYYKANQKEARAIIAKVLRQDPALLAQITMSDFPGKVDPALAQWWIDAGIKRGLVKRAFDPAELFYETVR